MCGVVGFWDRCATSSDEGRATLRRMRERLRRSLRPEDLGLKLSFSEGVLAVESREFVLVDRDGTVRGRYDVLDYCVEGGTLLLNAPFSKDEVGKNLPRKVQEGIIEKKLKVYAIDAYRVAADTGMGARINSIMQTCFFAISGVLPRDEAIAQIKKAIEKTYGMKGAEVVKRNFAAVDATLEHLHEVEVPAKATATRRRPPTVSEDAPDFVRNWLTWGAGPRAGQYMILGGKARAVLNGRYYVATEDIRHVAHPVLRHPRQNIVGRQV